MYVAFYEQLNERIYEQLDEQLLYFTQNPHFLQ